MRPHDERRLATLKTYEPAEIGRDHGLDALCNLVRMTFDVPMAAVTLVDDRFTHHVGLSGMELDRLPNEQTFCSRTIEQTMPMMIPDATQDTRFAENPFVVNDPGVRYYVGAPLIAPDGSTLGAICGIDTRPRVHSEDAVLKLASLASTAVEILELRRRMSEVRTMALTDPLTGIANRAGIEMEIEKAIALLERHGVPFGIVYFDVDHFKSVNDSYGHEAGDKLLRLIGQSLSGRTRREESSGRLGGDEFLVVLLGASLNEARTAAERIKEVLDRAVKNDSFRVSFSMGVTTFTKAPSTVAAALSAADSLLYVAKRAGKNQIVANEGG
ncbi:sensor domain-containing diguanylate cyclase [Acidisoma silvae]|uniref:diguanylate cyclase n=1 Tax=Acidisoma silvae TaxID=2802396 RepID=A0A963YP36_9PROT|nr:sensor domain-containing diguanylate cyclase [Acidisoma silvae]MCB8874369.1 sensor domain-containing diguanylate cyclase [Acidisoma silvae]